MYKERILTGDRPTGTLHLGHYVGSLQSRVELQNKYETFILIADVQALTDNFNNPDKIRKNIIELLKDYLAVGIDPTISKIVLQSGIPQIAELTVFYSNLVTVNRLLRNPTVKSEIREKFADKNIPFGFLGYPVSQAADITSFMADLVPVGDDQLPVLEQTVEIVKSFNSIYGKVLKVPKSKLSKLSRLVGLDGKSKMSKSLGNTISFADTLDDVRNKIMSMYTDPSRIHKSDPGHVAGNPVFIYHDAFNVNKDEVNELKELYTNGKIGDVEVKEKLFIAIKEFLLPIQERRHSFDGREDYLYDILQEGTLFARGVAAKTLDIVKDAMKLIQYN
jgi:tryptophanyl-tRNA synthetase